MKASFQIGLEIDISECHKECVFLVTGEYPTACSVSFTSHGFVIRSRENEVKEQEQMTTMQTRRLDRALLEIRRECYASLMKKRLECIPGWHVLSMRTGIRTTAEETMHIFVISTEEISMI